MSQDPTFEALLDQLRNRLNPTQEQLFRECAELDGSRAQEVLGALLRFMLEPDVTFWTAVHMALHPVYETPVH